jgi:hypothetical protein
MTAWRTDFTPFVLDLLDFIGEKIGAALESEVFALASRLFSIPVVCRSKRPKKAKSTQEFWFSPKSTQDFWEIDSKFFGIDSLIILSGPNKSESIKSLIHRLAPKIRESQSQRILIRFPIKTNIRESISATHRS